MTTAFSQSGIPSEAQEHLDALINDPVPERLTQLGPWRYNDVVNAAATPMYLSQFDAANAPNFVLALRSGRILAIGCRAASALVTRSNTFQCTVDGVAVGSTLVIAEPGANTQQNFANITPISFVAGARLGVSVADAGAGAATTNDLYFWMLVSWGAS